MQLGRLDFAQISDPSPLLAEPVNKALTDLGLDEVYAVAIDPSLADTAAFCAKYEVGLEVSANCVIVEAKRGDRTWYAACMILATDRADINGVIRRHLDARKVSFASMETATSLTHMEYGGITPVGLPEDWVLLVDSKVAATKYAVIGSGLRTSKLLVPGHLLANLPHSSVLDLAKVMA